MSKEKTYLKWYNKVGYGSGDVAGNVVYALLTSLQCSKEVLQAGWKIRISGDSPAFSVT